jgi:hypothetical protein
MSSSVDTVTNFLDVGGATNTPTRFYRAAGAVVDY